MNLIESIQKELSELSFDDKVQRINELRQAIHNESPFKHEPVDFVRWVKNDTVTANDYNPNKVAPPEMRLLELSIANDGYTQPIVTWDDVEKETIEVIDGFHRNRVGKESKVIAKRVQGYLPIVNIRQEQSSKKDRMASTIRHNRARGKHQVDAMSEIVIELKNRNWNNKRIARELGMDEEEVLRLCQISGIEHLFTDKDFSRAWEADDSNEDFEPITDEITEDDLDLVKIPHEGLDTRVFHTYEKWECHKAGFYASNVEGMTKAECEQAYCDFFKDFERFREGLDIVITEWKHSCEHYLTNPAMNRIAWLGQAAMCAMTGIPSKYCSGFSLMNEVDQDMANMVALEALNEWMVANDLDEIDMNQALSAGRQVEIY